MVIRHGTRQHSRSPTLHGRHGHSPTWHGRHDPSPTRRSRHGRFPASHPRPLKRRLLSIRENTVLVYMQLLQSRCGSLTTLLAPML